MTPLGFMARNFLAASSKNQDGNGNFSTAKFHVRF